MSDEYKVKISDGSVVGPLDEEMLQTWYEQGLLTRESAVLPMRTQRWTRLREVLNVGTPARGRSKKERAARAQARAAAGPPPPWAGGRMLAGAFLVAGAAAAVGGWLIPNAFRADLGTVPWRELGYGQLLLGLTALHHANWSRLFARVGVCLAGLAVFPVIGLLIARGVRPDALLVPASAWLMTSGLFFMLSPILPTRRIVGSIAALLVGIYGVVHFGLALDGVALLHVVSLR